MITDRPQAKVIHALIKDQATYLLSEIRPEWFWHPQYAKLLGAIAETMSNGQVLSLDGVIQTVQAGPSNEKEKQLLIAAVKSICAGSESWDEGIIEALQENYKLHEIGKLRGLFSAEADSTPGEIMRAVEKAADAFRGISETDEPDNALTIAKEYVERMERGEETKEAQAAIKIYDIKLQQMFYGQMIYACPLVIGARPGFGKTALLANLILDFISSGNGGIIYNLENSSTTFVSKILAMKSDVNYAPIVMGMASADEKVRLKESISDSMGKLYLRDKNMTIDQWERDVRKQIMTKRNIRWVAVDFIQSFLGMGKDTSVQAINLSRLMRMARDLSKQFMIPVILLSQMNERKEDKKTGEVVLSIGELKGSSSIEEFARQIILLMGNSASGSRIMRLVKNEFGPFLEREFEAKRETGRITQVYAVNDRN